MSHFRVETAGWQCPAVVLRTAKDEGLPDPEQHLTSRVPRQRPFAQQLVFPLDQCRIRLEHRARQGTRLRQQIGVVRKARDLEIDSARLPRAEQVTTATFLEI